MKKLRFTELQRPVITCILKETSVDAAIATIRNGEFQGAPAFAVHLEALGTQNLTDENLRRIADATRRPVMFLHYRFASGLGDDECVEILRRAARCGASCVDITADTFDPSPLEYSSDPVAADRQRRLVDEFHSLGAEVVISSHVGQPLSCDQVLERMKDVESRGADFAKIVTVADTEEQFLDALRTTMALRREMNIPFIHLCNGKFGLPHRYFAPSLGNALTFSVERYREDYVTGQPPLRNMLNVLGSYGWHIDDTI